MSLDVINLTCFVFTVAACYWTCCSFFFLSLFFPLWKKPHLTYNKTHPISLDNQNNVLLENDVRSYRRKHLWCWWQVQFTKTHSPRWAVPRTSHNNNKNTSMGALEGLAALWEMKFHYWFCCMAQMLKKTKIPICNDDALKVDVRSQTSW